MRTPFFPYELVITPAQVIGYGLNLYSIGSIFVNHAKALSFLHEMNISHVSIWKWIQKYKPKKKIRSNGRHISEDVIDDAVIKSGSGCTWLWITIETKELLWD